MKRLVLISMPFADIVFPSLALTQIKSVIDSDYRDNVITQVLYINHDLANWLGVELYNEIHNGLGNDNGLGDWFFRKIAFLDCYDNTEEYFERFDAQLGRKGLEFKNLVLEKRNGLEGFLDGIIEKYRLHEADIIGFTSVFYQNVASFALARKIKSINKDNIIVMGGPNCNAPAGQEIVKNIESIDYVFSGPGLVSFKKFIKYYLDGEENKFNSIIGLFSKESVQLSDHSELIYGEYHDMDMDMQLDYEGFLNSFYSNFSGEDIKPILLLQSSRGCWWGEKCRCTFCALDGPDTKHLAMKPSTALKQIESIMKYSDRCSHFEFVDNIIPKGYLEEVFPKLKMPENVSLFCEIKATLSKEELKALSDAKVRCIQAGIEALSTEALKLMNKGTTAFQNITLLKNCGIYDISVVWLILWGFPGESEEIYRKYLRDIPLLKHLPPPRGIFHILFQRYSTYFNDQQKYNLELKPYDFYKYVYPFDEKFIENIAYYFNNYKTNDSYTLQKTKCIFKISTLIDSWINAWKSEDSSQIPKLLFDKVCPKIVVDTRTGTEVKHALDDMDFIILNYLNKPGDVEGITSITGLLPNEVEDRILSLKERKLIFEENGKFLNLVLSDEIKEKYYKNYFNSVFVP